MAYRLRVTTQAEEHVRAALMWWLANRPAAPDLLLAELRRGVEIITSEPGVGSPLDDEGYEGVRTLFLDRVGITSITERLKATRSRYSPSGMHTEVEGRLSSAPFNSARKPTAPLRVAAAERPSR